MRGVLLLAVAGCYAPSIASDVPCAPPGSGARCPAGQVCVMRAGVEVCTPDGASDVDASTDGPNGGFADWWDTRWTRRRSVDITAGANGAPSGYSISVDLDHAALVGAGSSMASGDDVRVIRETGAREVDRVLDTGASWNTSSTRIWFATTSALAAGATVRYWIYYGNPGANQPPDEPKSVFLFAEDFESSTAAWSFDQGVALSTARAHRGSRSVSSPATANLSKDARLGSVDEMNLVWDVWWNIDDLASADMAQYVRGNNNSEWMTNLQPPGAGMPSTWDIAKIVNGAYSEVIPPPQGAQPPPVDTWFRVTMYAYGDKMAVDIAGTRYVPPSGFSSIGATSSGDVGVGSYNGTAPVWFDDATLRRLVLPEPSIVVGAPQSVP